MAKKNTGYSYNGRTIWQDGDYFYTISKGRAETLPTMYRNLVISKLKKQDK